MRPHYDPIRCDTYEVFFMIMIIIINISEQVSAANKQRSLLQHVRLKRNICELRT